jgi:glyoxylase-like metal-dependent hydrolase (beta-lactamase superfamily II)
MPEFFAQKHCLDYHKEREALKVTSVGSGDGELGRGISVFHVPGHSPDCLALLIDNEVMLTGDSILPEITTHPTREAYFQGTKSVLPSHYTAAEQLYGLRAYIRSVKHLREVSHRLPNLTILPSHRLFSNGTWNLLNLGQRCDELIQHHMQRCSDIIGLVGSEPKTPEEIAREHFEPRLLKGFGINLAVNEVLSHCELLGRCGDVTWTDGKVLSTGKRGFQSFIEDI